MISDFIMDGVNSDLERRIHAAREQETKFFSTVISRVANPASLEFFDRTWVYDAHKEGMLKEIVGGYQRI